MNESKELVKIARELTSGIKDLRVADILDKDPKIIKKMIVKLMRQGTCKVFTRGVKIELSWSIDRGGKSYPIMLGEMLWLKHSSKGLKIKYTEKDLLSGASFKMIYDLRPQDKLGTLLDIDYSARGFVKEKEGLLESADALSKTYAKKTKELDKSDKELNILIRDGESSETKDLESRLDKEYEEVSKGRERLRDTLSRSNLLSIWQRV